MSQRSLFTQASLMKDENFNDSSLRTFLVLYKMDTTNANVGYLIGQLYLQTPAHKADALPYMEKAVKHITKKYIPNDPYEKDVTPIAYYLLGRAQHITYQFDAAIENFNRFEKLLPESDFRRKDIDYMKTCCYNGKDLMQYPVDCKIIDLGDSINSSYPDYSPVLSADEQDLLFTSRRPKAAGDSETDINGHYYEDIWISHAKPGGGWTTATNPGFPLNTPGNDASVSFSPDGQQLILYQVNGDGAGEIYASYLHGYQWTYPQFVDSASPGKVNSSAMESSACLSPDQKTLYFASGRAGGQGGTDIYKIDVNNGKWGAPVNLGTLINTEYDEDAPFIHADDSTMFFSSKGHNTMGGFDVFMAQEDASGQWGKVKNVGYPINTPDDDIYFSVSADGRRAYYSSVRKEGHGEKDIYEVLFNKPLPVQPVAVLVGYIKTPDGSPLPNDIKITASEVNSTEKITTSANYITGKFLQVMRPNKTYNITISTQGKYVFNHNFYLSADSSYASLSRAFYRGPIILGDTTNVFAPKKKVIIPVATVQKANMSGRILLNEDPVEPLSDVHVNLTDANGNVLQTIITASNGAFTFSDLKPDQHYALEISTKDTKLKHLKKLKLVNPNGHIVRNYDDNVKKLYYFHNLPVDLNTLPELMEVAQVNNTTVKHRDSISSNNPSSFALTGLQFTRYFGYNLDDVSENDEGFKPMVDKLASKLAEGNVKMVIEASASKVPTKLLHSSNPKLAEERAKAAKEAVITALKNKNADIAKLTVELHSNVGGPHYEHDAKDESKYQKYQYVKIYLYFR